MYSVLLVDDERIIREGLSKKISWRRYNLALFGEASNGEEGLEKILQNDIHIVITDVKMPGMDGLELIRRAQEVKPDLRFIVLSGYDEFEFAQQAMQYGVHYYLLKPTKPKEIDRILKEVSEELTRQEEERSFIDQIKEKMHKSLPLIKEQFFRDLVMHKMYTSREMSSYLSSFDIPPDSVGNASLILFSPAGEHSYEKLFSLQLMCKSSLNERSLLFSTIIKESLAVVVREMNTSELLERIGEIKNRFKRIYSQSLTVAISDSAPLKSIHTLYEQARNCLKYRFYCGDDGVITPQDTVDSEDKYNRSDLDYYIEEACLAIQCGNESEYRAIIGAFWDELRKEKLPQESIHNALIDLLLSAARYNRYDELSFYIDYLKRIGETDTLECLEALIDECFTAVVRKNYEQFRSKKNRLVEKMKEKTLENIDRPELSLKWLANTLIYANVDYLSKLFKHETGEPFKHYLNRLRVDKAKDILKGLPEMPVAEVARSVGFGENAHYFCQVFRKYAGRSPSEHRRSCISALPSL